MKKKVNEMREAGGRDRGGGMRLRQGGTGRGIVRGKRETIKSGGGVVLSRRGRSVRSRVG